MKNLIASTLVATAALTGAAYAATTPSLDSEARYIVPGADFSDLTASEIRAINSAIHGSGTASEKQAYIRALLN
ncbi:hypothetical protein KUW09_24490 [Mameliella alba]|nr:hypothetical protein [Mameliella alba]MCA0957286.1 hypothetical protein [Mameliella alba]